MSKTFEDIERKLNLADADENDQEDESNLELERAKKLKEEKENIDKDFEYVRLSIISDCESAEAVIDKLKRGVLKDKMDDRNSARKGEVMGQLLKIKNELRKGIMDIYRVRRDLIFQDRSTLEEEGNHVGVRNLSDVLKAYELEKEDQKKKLELDLDDDLF